MANRLAPRYIYVDFDRDRNLEEEEPVAMDPGLSEELSDPHFLLPPVQGRFRLGGEVLHVHMRLRLGLLLPNLVRGRTVLTVHPRTWFAGTLPVAPHCRVFWVPGEEPRFRVGMRTVSSSTLYFGDHRIFWQENPFRIENGRFTFAFEHDRARKLVSMSAPADLHSIWACRRIGDDEDLTCIPAGGKVYLPPSTGYEVRAASYMRCVKGEEWLLHVSGRFDFRPGTAFPPAEPLDATFSVQVSPPIPADGGPVRVWVHRRLRTASGLPAGLWRQRRKLSVAETEFQGEGGDILHSAMLPRTVWDVPPGCRGSRIVIGARLAPDLPFEIRVEETEFTP